MKDLTDPLLGVSLKTFIDRKTKAEIYFQPIDGNNSGSCITKTELFPAGLGTSYFIKMENSDVILIMSPSHFIVTETEIDSKGLKSFKIKGIAQNGNEYILERV